MDTGLSSLGSSATMASVVRISPATEAAFCSASPLLGRWLPSARRMWSGRFQRRSQRPIPDLAPLRTTAPMRSIAKLIYALSAALAVGTIPLAPAQNSMGKEPGERLLARCEPARRLIDRGVAEGLSSGEQADAQGCLGFIEGFVWGHAWASWREARDMWFCLPQGFTGEQGVPVVVDYLEAHPDRLQEDAHLLVFLALTAAYPCTVGPP